MEFEPTAIRIVKAKAWEVRLFIVPSLIETHAIPETISVPHWDITQENFLAALDVITPEILRDGEISIFEDDELGWEKTLIYHDIFPKLKVHITYGIYCYLRLQHCSFGSMLPSPECNYFYVVEDSVLDKFLRTATRDDIKRLVAIDKPTRIRMKNNVGYLAGKTPAEKMEIWFEKKLSPYITEYVNSFDNNYLEEFSDWTRFTLVRYLDIAALYEVYGSGTLFMLRAPDGTQCLYRLMDAYLFNVPIKAVLGRNFDTMLETLTHYGETIHLLYITVNGEKKYVFRVADA